MSPITPASVAAVVALTPGRVSRRRMSGEPRTRGARARSSWATSASRKSTVRREASSVSRSSAGRTSRSSQVRPRVPNTSLTGGRPARLRSRTAWTWFLAFVRCRTRWTRRPTRRRRAWVASSPTQTSGRKPEASSWASVRASIRSVFARSRVAAFVALGLASTTRTCGSRIRTIASALPVASRVTLSSGRSPPANASISAGAVPIRPAARTRPPSAIATSQKSRWMSSPIERMAASSRYGWRRGGRTTPTDACSRHTRAVAGAANYKLRALSP